MRLAILLTAVSILGGTAAPARAQAPDFATEVWPIFEARCVKCHGEKKQKGELRLDTRAFIEAGGENGAVFVAGNTEESVLHKLIVLPADDPDIMPGSGDPLTPEQIGVITGWIAEGADFGAWTVAVAPPAEAPAGGDDVVPTLEEVLAALAEGVTPASEESLNPLREAGALVLPLDQKTPLLRVDFNLQGDAINDEALALLAPIADQLTWLNLAKTKVTDAGLAQLTALTKLTRLHLENTGIGDPALAHLSGLQNLQYLNLYGTQVSDAGLGQIAGLPHLEKLYLWQTQVTPAGAEKLAAAIPGIQTSLGEELAPDPPAEEEKTEEEMKEEAPAEAAPAEEAPAEEAPAAVTLAALFDADGCCAKAKAEGKDCDHPCCIEAREKGEVCAKCNPGAPAFLELTKHFDEGGCCAKALAEGKKCDHPCCVEAREKGEVCTKCNPGAEAAAPAVTPDPANLIAAAFDEGSCCAVARADGKDCDHPCCAEAREKGEACAKCNPGAAAFSALAASFDADACCATAQAEGKKCDHPCCVEARAKGEVCAKCNPGAAAKTDPPAEEAPAVTLFDEGGCCATAVAAGKDCDHPCCVEARVEGKVCTKCNPKAKPAREA